MDAHPDRRRIVSALRSGNASPSASHRASPATSRTPSTAQPYPQQQQHHAAPPSAATTPRAGGHASASHRGADPTAQLFPGGQPHRTATPTARGSVTTRAEALVHLEAENQSLRKDLHTTLKAAQAMRDEVLSVRRAAVELAHAVEGMEGHARDVLVDLEHSTRSDVIAAAWRVVRSCEAERCVAVAREDVKRQDALAAAEAHRHADVASLEARLRAATATRPTATTATLTDLTVTSLSDAVAACHDGRARDADVDMLIEHVVRASARHAEPVSIGTFVTPAIMGLASPCTVQCTLYAEDRAAVAVQCPEDAVAHRARATQADALARLDGAAAAAAAILHAHEASVQLCFAAKVALVWEPACTYLTAQRDATTWCHGPTVAIAAHTDAIEWAATNAEVFEALERDHGRDMHDANPAALLDVAAAHIRAQHAANRRLRFDVARQRNAARSAAVDQLAAGAARDALSVHVKAVVAKNAELDATLLQVARELRVGLGQDGGPSPRRDAALPSPIRKTRDDDGAPSPSATALEALASTPPPTQRSPSRRSVSPRVSVGTTADDEPPSPRDASPRRVAERVLFDAAASALVEEGHKLEARLRDDPAHAAVESELSQLWHQYVSTMLPHVASATTKLERAVQAHDRRTSRLLPSPHAANNKAANAAAGNVAAAAKAVTAETCVKDVLAAAREVVGAQRAALLWCESQLDGQTQGA